MKIREKHTRDNRQSVSIFVSRHFDQSSTCSTPIFQDNLHTCPNHVCSKGTIASIYEIQVTGGINMSQEGEGPQSDDKESCEELKDKS